jgi:hypothetical protein
MINDIILNKEKELRIVVESGLGHLGACPRGAMIGNA